MRTMIAVGVIAILTLAAIGTLAKTRVLTAYGTSPTPASVMNPSDMMKNTKDLPVQDIKDAF